MFSIVGALLLRSTRERVQSSKPTYETISSVAVRLDFTSSSGILACSRTTPDCRDDLVDHTARHRVGLVPAEAPTAG
jgi:hypothetical protein